MKSEPVGPAIARAIAGLSWNEKDAAWQTVSKFANILQPLQRERQIGTEAGSSAPVAAAACAA
eukprot:2459058-Lingulodinium_polyedra.AAC.1